MDHAMTRPDSVRDPAGLPGLNVAGYMTAELGVGEAARGYVSALKTLGMPIALYDFGIGTISRKADHSLGGFSADTPHPINLITVNVDQLPAFAAFAPAGFLADRINVGFWWWELPDFPAEWADRFAPFDEIWTGSTFSRDAMRGLSPIPVHCVPPVVWLGEGPALPKAHFGLPEEDYTFLFVFDFLSVFERKNPLAVVSAFQAAFGRDERVRLVIKCINGEFDLPHLKRLHRATEDPRVTVMDGYMSRAEKDALIGACDCYVSLHRAEGFGLTLAEAMLRGKPVIATGWSGNMDFMTPENSYPVAYRLIPVAAPHGPYKPGQTWADPDVADAARQMRRVVDHPAAAAEKARLGRLTIEAQHAPATVAQCLAARIAAVAAAPRASRSAWQRPARIRIWRWHLSHAIRRVLRWHRGKLNRFLLRLDARR
jgi:glycosyltransferase involved in cell wall biosynthesis